MQITALSHSMDDGWSQPFPDWDSDRTLITVFAAPDYIDEPNAIAEIVAAFPKATIVGCSSSGEIHGTKVLDRSLAVAVTRFGQTEIRVASAKIEGSDGSTLAGKKLATELDEIDLRAVFLVSEGLNVNGSDLAGGVNAVVAERVIVTGGLAGDGDAFERTWVLVDGQPLPNHAVAVGFYGDRVRVGHGSKGGWDKFGPERLITRSDGNVLFELDSQPALQLYRDYLGEHADGLPATGLLFPLALRTGDEDEEQLVRTILSIDEEAQSLTFAGDLPEGMRAQLMRANFDRLVGGAESAAMLAGDAAANGPVLAIAISCVGRRLVLGERIEEETEATLDVLPDNTVQVGFYSYGELSPYASGACDLHNQTMTMTTIYEV